MDYTCEEDRRQEKSLIGKSVQLLHDSSIYHRHIEHFFTFLAGNTVFSLLSESPR